MEMGLGFLNLIGRLPLAQRPSWLPPQGSTTAPGADAVFYLILSVAAFFFVLVVACMVLFVIRYRRRPGHQSQTSPAHHTMLEVTWTVIPTIIVAVIFYQGFVAFMDMRTPPANAYQIRVTAFKWGWSFEYPNGHSEAELHVPANEPIELVMRSEDVIHSLSIPAFRVKMDCVPGRYTKTWFQAVTPESASDAVAADGPRTYDLYCTEYCGKDHANMLSKVHVYRTRGEFEAWLEDAANVVDKMPPVKAGEYLFQQRHRCNQCHNVDGRRNTGPPLNGIFGELHKMSDGSTVVVDENYIRNSILNPQGQIRSGFQGVMPTYKGRIKDEEIDVIIEYLKSLKE
jgi:cytochrome c oxidase subunit 2